MKVIKRDGRAVDYDRKKIEIAIGKANNEVKESERVTEKEIKACFDMSKVHFFDIETTKRIR